VENAQTTQFLRINLICVRGLNKRNAHLTKNSAINHKSVNVLRNFHILTDNNASAAIFPIIGTLNLKNAKHV
jgi:hypothetical protein